MQAGRCALFLLAVGTGFTAVPVAAQTSLGPPAPSNSQPPLVQPGASGPPRQGFSFNPDAGVIYQSGDFRVTAWGFAERAIDPDGPDYFRRVRQGAEVDLPRISDHLRIAGVYEFDRTNMNAFGINPGPAGAFGRRDAENLFIARQDADDPGKFRLLVGENTHILSHDDNLSSGNLPTINRSLILEEHGSVNSFGTQFGIQLQKALSDKLTMSRPRRRSAAPRSRTKDPDGDGADRSADRRHCRRPRRHGRHRRPAESR